MAPTPLIFCVYVHKLYCLKTYELDYSVVAEFEFVFFPRNCEWYVNYKMLYNIDSM